MNFVSKYFLLFFTLNTIVFSAVVKVNTGFITADTIIVEILETGDTRNIDSSGNAVFTDLLPNEYNICVRALDINETCKKVIITNADSSYRLVFGDLKRIKKDTSDIIGNIISPKKDTADFVITSKDTTSGYKLQKVTVTGKKKEKIALGRQTISQKTIKRMPVFVEPDIMRIVQMQSGVVSSSDFSNKMYVRGGASDQNLILLDNAVVYCPSHFGGLFSTFVVDAIKDMDFYKSGFGVGYGNRLSSVLDIKQRTAKQGYIHGRYGLSLLSTNVGVESSIGPLGVMVNRRKTFIEEMTEKLKDAGLMKSSIPYNFSDTQSKVDFTPYDKVKFSYSNFFGRDILDFEDLMKLDWGNKVHSVNYRIGNNESMIFKGTAYQSSFDQTIDFTIMKMYNDIKEQALKSEVLFVAEDNKVSVGGEANRFNVVFKQTLNWDEDTIVIADSLVKKDLASLYVQNIWNVNDNVKITGGLRGSFYEPTDYIGIDPRLSVNYTYSKNLEFMAHCGMYHQYITSIMFMGQEMPTEFWYALDGSMKTPTSIFYSGGIKKKWNESITLITEGYYKKFSNLLLFMDSPDVDASVSDSPPLSDFFRSADGFASGLEINLSKEKGWLTANVSYSLGFSVISDRDTLLYANWDKRHNLKLSGTASWLELPWLYGGDKHKIFSSFALTLGSGLPHSPTLGIEESRDFYSANTTTSEIKGVNNSARYPVYKKVDITPFRYEYTGKYVKASCYWSVINVFDWKNVYLYVYKQDQGNKPERKEINMLPRIPIFVGGEISF